MNTRDAVDLIAGAVDDRGGTWADIGAGNGTFTRALLARLGPRGHVYAVDQDARALTALRGVPHVDRIVADFTGTFALPDLVDGMLLANVLHFVEDQTSVLARLVQRVKPGGRVAFIEYDRRGASRWVPYPISSEDLPRLTAAAGLTAPRIVGRRASAYSGDLYVAVSLRS